MNAREVVVFAADALGQVAIVRPEHGRAAVLRVIRALAEADERLRAVLTALADAAERGE